MTGARALKTLLQRAGFWLLVSAIGFYALFPFYYAVVTSLRSGSALFTVAWWPESFDLSNYRAVFAGQPFGRNILNSILVAAGVVTVSLGLAASAAYAFGRIAFRGRGLLLLTILAVSMFPQVAVLSGMFELIRLFGLYNSLPGLILANLMLTLPFTVWVLTVFMRELPRELEESALVDGATHFDILWRIFLPLMAPAAVTTGLLAFVVAWNEFLFALTFTLTDENRTVPVAIALMSGATAFELPWGMIMAASVIVTVPVVILVLVFQRRIVAGLTAGAVKG
jgi:trehalose/maltose transport system permease protein